MPSDKPRLDGPTRPLGSPDIPQFHLPATGIESLDRLYGAATIQFGDRKRRLADTRRAAFIAPLDPSTRTVDWDQAQSTPLMPDALLKDAPIAASYLPLPSGAMELQKFTRWAKNFDRWLARTQKAEFTTKQEPPETLTLGPKRGGVSVELVAIVWELT